MSFCSSGHCSEPEFPRGKGTDCGGTVLYCYKWSLLPGHYHASTNEWCPIKKDTKSKRIKSLQKLELILKLRHYRKRTTWSQFFQVLPTPDYGFRNRSRSGCCVCVCVLSFKVDGTSCSLNGEGCSFGCRPNRGSTTAPPGTLAWPPPMIPFRSVADRFDWI